MGECIDIPNVGRTNLFKTCAENNICQHHYVMADRSGFLFSSELLAQANSAGP